MTILNETLNKPICVIEINTYCCKDEVTIKILEHKLTFEGKGGYDCGIGSYDLCYLSL